jgi:hypothetical protein
MLRRSRYIDWLRAGQPISRSSSPGRIKNFQKSSRPAVESNQTTYPSASWTHSPGVERQVREADHSPPTSAEVHSPTRLHGVMLIYLSTGTILNFFSVSPILTIVLSENI